MSSEILPEPVTAVLDEIEVVRTTLTEEMAETSSDSGCGVRPASFSLNMYGTLNDAAQAEDCSQFSPLKSEKDFISSCSQLPPNTTYYDRKEQNFFSEPLLTDAETNGASFPCNYLSSSSRIGGSYGTIGDEPLLGSQVSNGLNPSKQVSSNHCWFTPHLLNGTPGARAAHSCDVVNGTKLFIFGGWNGKKAMNDLYVLDTQKMVWSQMKLKDAPPERNNHTTAVVGHRLYAHGGHDGTKWLDDLYVLDTEAGIWIELVINGKAPSARACHTLSRVNDKLYMFGGYDGSKCFNDIDILDLDTMSWIQPKVHGKQPQARNAHSVTVIDTKLFLFGGHSGNKHLTDLHVFDTFALRWTQPNVQGSPPPGLRGHTANLIGDRVFLFGGYDGKGRSNELFILESVKLKWIHPQEAEYAPVGRQRHTATLIGAKRLFIFGGFDGTKWLNDLHVLDVGRLTEDELTDGAIRNLINNLRKLICDTEFSDVTLVVENREIPAHRNILAAQCDYFKSMFSNKMKESTESRIIIPGWSYHSFMAMLEFLYTGRMSESSPSVVCDVLGLADLCALDGLKTLCENILKHSVDNENVCHLLRNADRYQAPELKIFCENFILKHATEVTRTKSFEELADYPGLMLHIAKLSLTKNCRDTRGGSGGDEDPGGI